MSCDVGEAMYRLENEAAHSPTLPPLYLHHMHFTYVTWPAAQAPMMMFNIHDDFVICNDCGPQDYMKDVNWPSNSKG